MNRKISRFFLLGTNEVISYYAGRSARAITSCAEKKNHRRTIKDEEGRGIILRDGKKGVGSDLFDPAALFPATASRMSYALRFLSITATD